MEKETRPTDHWIVHALLTGAALRARDIAEMVSAAARKPVNPQEMGRRLSRIGDGEKCNLGHFIQKSRCDNTWIYQMVKPALCLPEAVACALLDPPEPGRPRLRDVMRDYPDLRRFVPRMAMAVGPSEDPPTPPHENRGWLTPAGTGAGPPATPPEKTGKDLSITLRAGEKYAFSVSGSPRTVFVSALIFMAVLLLTASLIYIFLFPVLVTLFFLGGGVLLGVWLFRSRRRAGRRSR